MENKETMQTEVYDKVKDVKNRFYNAKTQDEWNQIKEDYKDKYYVFDRRFKNAKDINEFLINTKN